MGTRLLCTDNPLAKLAVIFVLNRDGLEDVDSSFASHCGGGGDSSLPIPGMKTAGARSNTVCSASSACCCVLAQGTRAQGCSALALFRRLSLASHAVRRTTSVSTGVSG